MTADEDALLANIAAHPADDVARLVYADWLDEHGQAVRAEFIRLQVEIARLQSGPRAVVDQNVRLWKRQQEMLDTYLPELLGSLAEVADRNTPVFERGFLAELALGLYHFRKHAGELVLLRPRPAVSVHATNHHYDYWLACPGLDIVTALILDSVYDEIAMNPLATNLLAAWRRFTGLRTLDLEGNHIGDDGLRAIPWADLPALIDLNLSYNGLTDDGIIALINTGLPQRLTRLVLGGNLIGDQAAYELADRVGSNAKLWHLNLRHTAMTSDGQNAILGKFGGRVDLF